MYALSPITLAALCFLSSAAVNAALVPRASNTCTYRCPPTDTAGFAFAPPPTNPSPGLLRCSYPAFSGEDPNDFFCDYSLTTGILAQDHDAGFCPTNAICATGSKRSNSQQPAVPVRRAKADGQPSPAKADKVAIRKFKKRMD